MVINCFQDLLDIPQCMAGLDNAFNTTFLACLDYRRISLKSISLGILFKNEMRDFP
jgi:hypothetical protein